MIERGEVAENTLEIAFELEGRTIKFEPGQYLFLAPVDPPYEDDRGNRRHFSFLDSPNRNKVVKIATRIRASGFKMALRDLPLGSDFEIEGPGGDFLLPADTRRRLVFLTGGIGITPFMSMSRWAMEEELPYRITLVYSNRNRDSAAYLGELEEYAQSDNYDLVLTMTDDPEWKGERGLVDAGFLERHLDSPTECRFMSAGPPNMVQALSGELEKLGVDEGMVRADNFAGY